MSTTHPQRSTTAPARTTTPPAPPTVVPADESEPERCPYCDRPLATDGLLALHVGEAHPDACTEAERDAHEAALEDESDDLFVFHLKVVAGLITLWAAFLIAYMVVLGTQG